MKASHEIGLGALALGFRAIFGGVGIAAMGTAFAVPLVGIGALLILHGAARHLDDN